MEIINNNANNADMVTMSSNGQSGVVNIVSSVGSRGLESGPSQSGLTMVECQNNNNCNQNRSNNNNNNNSNGETASWKNLCQDPGKINKLRDIVETSASMESKCLVESLVQQVSELSDLEKFLLYLKLPTGRSPDLDPLKQPLNPLGSRSEIQLTITWMKTHLEVDHEVSLPKEEVYNEYTNYCNINGFKALSTADFGKVMKQVFPSVRARRLGQRGASKYCHSGLRKKYILDAPGLPDLSLDNSSNVSSHVTNKNGVNIDYSIDEIDKATSNIIFEWAEKSCNVRVDSYKDLAFYLLDNNLVDKRSMAAFTLLSVDQRSGNNCGKHRETQYQLQKKLQEREQIKEQKRKFQEQQSGLSKTCTDRPKTRRRSGSVRNQSGESSSNAAVLSGYNSSKSNGKFVVDSEARHNNGVNNRYEVETNNNKLITEIIDSKATVMPLNILPTNIKQEEPSCGTDYPDVFDEKKDLVQCSIGNNINNNSANTLSPINGSKQKLLRATSLDSTDAGTKAPSPKTYYVMSNISSGSNNSAANSSVSSKNKYKPIQPKSNNYDNVNNVNNNLSETGTLIAAPCLQWGETLNQSQPELNSSMMVNSLTGDRFKQFSKCSSSAQQEQEEIAVGICHNDNDDIQKSSQISELRKLLQRNLPPGSTASCIGIPSASLTLSDEHQHTDSEHDMSGPGCRRRVSFQSAGEGIENLSRVNPLISRQISNQVPPSPSMGTKFNFTPINNTACGGLSQGPSQASSANASPFVSPRSTPLHRSRHNSGQTSSTYVTPRSTPYTPEIFSQGGGHSECTSPFMSPAPTPVLSRIRHNSSQNMRNSYTPTSRTRHSSGAPSIRHTPYPEDACNRRSKCRSRNSSGSIPPSPQSAPLSPLVHDSSSHPLVEPNLFHSPHQQMVGSQLQNILMKQQQQQSYGGNSDMRRRHMSAGPAIHYQPQHPVVTYPVNNPSVNIAHNDILGQEVFSVMNNPQMEPSNLPPGSTNRPQSVPLPQMLNTACSSDTDVIAKSHPNTPLISQHFQYSQDCYLSQPSSYAPTPVPSEYQDFTDYPHFDYDPVLGGGSEDSRAAGLESLESFSTLPSQTDFSSTLTDSLTAVTPNDGLIDTHFSETSSNHPLHCNNEASQCMHRSMAQLSTCVAATSLDVKTSNPLSAMDHNMSSKNVSQQNAPSFNGGSHITLNALNLGPSDGPFDAPSSHLEDDLQPLVDLGSQEFFENILSKDC